VEFKDILHLVFQSHFKFEESQKVNIQNDPWENYLYHDSKFLFDLIFASVGRESFSKRVSMQIETKQGMIRKIILLFNRPNSIPTRKFRRKIYSIKILAIYLSQ
jgi:hypothetical protein